MQVADNQPTANSQHPTRLPPTTISVTWYRKLGSKLGELTPQQLSPPPHSPLLLAFLNNKLQRWFQQLGNHTQGVPAGLPPPAAGINFLSLSVISLPFYTDVQIPIHL